MKKTLLALALLGAFAGAASAQTNVTVYGVVDAGLTYANNGTAKTTALGSGLLSGSRLGFRGTENLGGGLSAIFTLENGFNVDDGSLGQGRLFGRQAFVGLTGSFGAVKLGRQYHPLRNALNTIDPFNLGNIGTASNIFNVYGDRGDNTINYSTPKLGGFKGELAYSLGEVAGSSSIGRQAGLSAGYAAGPFNVILAHHDQNQQAAGVATGDSRTTLLGGTYDFRVVKLHAAYALNKGSTAAGVKNVDRDEAMIGVSVPLGAGKILASYILRRDDMGANRDAEQLALGYIYSLSKRTNLYTSVARINNEAAASVNAGGFAGGAGVAGTDRSTFSVGVRHSF
ncbi:MAG: hypothetical protein A3I66_06405 [Burkholderiales bacterium RIFCSPLOWO2_02_FULL_57_36]|nr:MAG: hypothetical protein A3I66_06405 [Burkholderiales bacterium RIFCSPLOWO2_02_FULL_57_36]